MIINNTSNLLNNNNKILHTSIQPSTTNNIIYNTSHESTPIIYPINDNLTVNPKVLSFTQQAKSNRVLDSACTDSSYRASDVPPHSIISFAPSNAQLDLTTANGSHVYSKGITSREFSPMIKTPIHVFKDEDLHLSMHALSSFTNHPVNGTVVLNKNGFKAYDSNNNLFCTNPKKENDKLWFLPPDIPIIANIQSSETSKGEDPHSILGQGNLFIKHEPNAVFVSYQAACFFNPCDSTFENAARMGWLGNLPRITAKMIAANRPHSMSTAYGHLNRLRQNLRSTTPKPPPPPKSSNISPSSPTQNLSDEKISDQLFIYNNDLKGEHPEEMVTKALDMADLSPAEKKALAIYFDATGKFPFESYDGATYVLICVFKNYIHAETMPDRTAPSYVKAYRSAFAFFKNLGHVFSIARLDNETSALLEQFLNIEAKVKHEFISTGSHRANKAERAIQSWKNHFVAGIASVDKDFPMYRWADLNEQCEITLNVLRSFTDNDTISAYEGIYGHKYDFLSHPIAPPDTKAIVYEPADKRPSWYPHGIAGFYLGPALKHYRSVRCYIPSTEAIRISDQCDFFPSKFKFPGASIEEILLNSINKLQISIDNNENLATIQPVLDQVKLATVNFSKNIVPTGPKAPDGLTEDEIEALNPPLILPFPPITTPLPTPLTDIEVENSSEEKRVIDDDTQRIDRNIQSTNTNYHHLRTEKSTRPKKDGYRALTSKELKNMYTRECKNKIGQHFFDKETKEEFVVDSICMKDITSGKFSKTLFYRYYLVSELLKPTAVRNYEYTPCSEISKDKTLTWVRRGSSALALSIRSSTPKDESRALNLTKQGRPLKYKTALELDRVLWTKCSEEEWNRLLENTLHPIWSSEIPQGTKVAYYNQQVKEKEVLIDGVSYVDARVRGTIGGDKLGFEGATTANTADYVIFKNIISATLHDVKYVNPDTRFINTDMVDFYLASPMEEAAYMMVLLKDIPMSIVNDYDLTKRARHGKVYFKVLLTMYGHPASGRLSNKLFFKTIESAGYYEDPIIPAIIRHVSLPTVGGLVVDDCGLKVRCKDDALHFINAVEKVWKVKVNWDGDKFLGLNIKWNYDPDNPTAKISNDTAIPDSQKRFYPGQKLKGCETPAIYNHYNYKGHVDEAKAPEPTYVPEETEFVQQFTGTYSHVARTVRYDLVTAVNNIAESQSKPTSQTLKDIDKLANYTFRYPDAYLLFKATDMILKIHYDSSLKPHARHKAGVVLYLSDKNAAPENIGNITEVVSKKPINEVASIAEGEYCTQFIAGQIAIHHRNILEAIGYSQPPTMFYGDNTTAIGIANDSVKPKKSKAFDKSYHWFRGQVRQGIFISKHISSELNVADYFTKPLQKADHKRQVIKLVTYPPATPLTPKKHKKVTFSERVY